MKNLVLVLSLLLSFSALAEVVTVKEGIKLNEDEDVVGTYFAVNEKRGRAAVTVEIEDSWDSEDDGREVRLMVEGLYYDQEAKEVRYNDVTCAKKKKVLGLFTVYKPTGNCVIELEERVTTLDDGWYVREVKVVDVLLSVK